MKHQDRYSLTARAQFDIDPYPRVHAAVLFSLPEARHWLDRMMADDESKPLCWNRILLLKSSGIIIESNQLPEVLTYDWKPGDPIIDEQHERWVHQFRVGRWHERPAEECVASNATVTRRAVKPARPRRPSDYVTVTELVANTDLSPQDARGILRVTETKPEFGWAWKKEELPRIRKLLGLK
jgi:hypothetical protein